MTTILLSLEQTERHCRAGNWLDGYSKPERRNKWKSLLVYHIQGMIVNTI